MLLSFCDILGKDYGMGSLVMGLNVKRPSAILGGPRGLKLSCAISSSLGGLVLLSACGGSGGGGPVSTPAPISNPTPTVAPTKTPTPVSVGIDDYVFEAAPSRFDTAEFRQSDGPLQHSAASAWTAGHIGAGVTIAVVDSGIDVDSPEFAGRIHTASKDVYDQNRPLEGPDAHGTHVALVAAAARDDNGVLGMAWGASILALRTDEPGSCAGTGGDAGGCLFDDAYIAKAVDYAVANNAKIINISLGGEGGATLQLQQSVANAVDAGALIVLAAGNADLDQVSQFVRQLVDAANGGVLVVGALTEGLNLTTYSNAPGSYAAQYLYARGDRICCDYRDGEILLEDDSTSYVHSGTSFAAPQVAGAAALLAQAFPNLTGTQIGDILLQSAFDVGKRGADEFYGMGVLDIARAFQPLGATSLAGEGASLAAPFALGDNAGAASLAMGDALSTASLPLLVMDAYDRAFSADIGDSLRGAALPNRLSNTIMRQQRRISMGLGGSGEDARGLVSFAIGNSGNGAPFGSFKDMRYPIGWFGGGLGNGAGAHAEAGLSRITSANVSFVLSDNVQARFAFGQSASAMTQHLQGQGGPAFQIAQTSAGDDGLLRHSDVAFAVRRKFGGWGITASAESGDIISGSRLKQAESSNGERREDGALGLGLAVDRRLGDRTLGGANVSLGLSWLGEGKTLLGARFHDAFGLAGSDSLFVDAAARWDFPGRWRLGASVRQGWTRARHGGLVANSRLSSRGLSLDIERAGVFGAADSLGFRLAQPLRVEGGALLLNLPQSYDYASLSAQFRLHSLSLSPQGREVMGELAWRGPFLSGGAAASLFYWKNPGHYANLSDDVGVAMRWTQVF